MSYVQIYACVMCVAVQTGSLHFAGLALLDLRPYSVRTYIYIYIHIYMWLRLIFRGTGELGKADYLHNQKGSPKGVLENRKGAGVIILLKCWDFLLWWTAAPKKLVI